MTISNVLVSKDVGTVPEQRDGDIRYDSATGGTQVYSKKGGGWVGIAAVSAASNAVVCDVPSYDGAYDVAGDYSSDSANGRLNLPDDKIVYQEPESYKVGDLVRMRDWGCKTFGVVEWVQEPFEVIAGDPPLMNIRWDYVENQNEQPPFSVEKEQIERQRDTSLMYSLMDKKIEKGGRKKFRVGDAVTHPMYQDSYGIVQDDPTYNNGWSNVYWQDAPYGYPGTWLNLEEVELAPLGKVLEDQMEKIKQDQQLKFDEQKFKIEEQETKLLSQGTTLAALEDEKAFLRQNLSRTQSETERLAQRFEMAIRRIEQLEGAGMEEEALEVERNEALPVLASMSKGQRIKTLALTVGGVVGKQVLARIASQSGLTQWLVHLLMGN